MVKPRGGRGLTLLTMVRSCGFLSSSTAPMSCRCGSCSARRLTCAMWPTVSNEVGASTPAGSSRCTRHGQGTERDGTERSGRHVEATSLLLVPGGWARQWVGSCEIGGCDVSSERVCKRGPAAHPTHLGVTHMAPGRLSPPRAARGPCGAVDVGIHHGSMIYCRAHIAPLAAAARSSLAVPARHAWLADSKCCHCDPPRKQTAQPHLKHLVG